MIGIRDDYKKGDKIILMEKPDKDNPKDRIVLALFNGEYVTWYYNKERDSYNFGHYFGTDLAAAVEEFKGRV